MDMIREMQCLKRITVFLAKTIEKNVGEYIHDIGICKDFQEKTQRTKYRRKKRV